MHVVSSVFTLSHRMLTAAADKGSHLMAHLAIGSSGRERPTKQHGGPPNRYACRPAAAGVHVPAYGSHPRW